MKKVYSRKMWMERGKQKVLFPFGILGNQGWDKTTTVRC